MLRTIKPRNARSKRALEAREPKEIEDERTTIFVKGAHDGEVVKSVMKDLMRLKKPHAVSFAKENVVRPFEDASSLAFWAGKNDASMFVIGQSTKKRPDGMVLARMYDGRVLDLCEVRVSGFESMASFRTKGSAVGSRPMMHFASELFDAHPRYVQIKSMLQSLFGGTAVEAVCLSGLEHVISVSVGPTRAGSEGELPRVHVRTYAVSVSSSGGRVPRVELATMGPCMDLTLRRWQEADAEMLKSALKRPKMAKRDVEQGLGKRKRNVEVDEMGDVRGRVHVGRQDLDRLQTRKMKGL